VAKFTEADVQRAIRQIEKMVLDGWSMPLSRKKACGAESNPLTIEVMKRDAYLHILNNYSQSMHNHQIYGRDEKGNIRGIKYRK
jgi:hypothetical protein